MTAPETVLHSSFGGEIRQVGSRRLACGYPGRFVSALLLFPVAVWTVGAAALLAGAVLDRRPGLFLGGLFGLGASAALFALVRARHRRMGWFDLDAEAGRLTHRRSFGGAEAWPLETVRFELAWDPFHRSFEQVHWLVARVPDGRGLRLGKGTRQELAPVLARLGDWALRVGPR